MSKLWLVFIAGPNSYNDIQEMVEPIHDLFAGLVVTYHGSPNDMEAKYLESVKNQGCVIYQPYCGRHFHSRNSYLWCGPIQNGDWCIQSDCLEHPNRIFIEKHVPYLRTMSKSMFYYYGKPFLFEFHESMRYEGTPHENLSRLDGKGRTAELNQMWPNEAQVRQNVRPQKRSVHHFILHYLSYYVGTPYGGNHMILGLEKNGDPNVLFPIRELRRMEFRDYCRELNLPLKAGEIKDFMVKNKDSLPEKFKDFIRKEKILNDVWRWYVVGDQNFVDDHDHANVIEIA